MHMQYKLQVQAVHLERFGNYKYSLNLSILLAQVCSRVIFSSNAIDPCIKHGSPQT